MGWVGNGKGRAKVKGLGLGWVADKGRGSLT